MSDDFGLLNLVGSPFLERIVREERLGGDQPNKPRNMKPKLAKKNADSAPPDESQKDDDSMSSNHIDLRI
jgi:hypothetical protein